jgi:hypothetical protein
VAPDWVLSELKPSGAPFSEVDGKAVALEAAPLPPGTTNVTDAFVELSIDGKLKPTNAVAPTRTFFWTLSIAPSKESQPPATLSEFF